MNEIVLPMSVEQPAAFIHTKCVAICDKEEYNLQSIAYGGRGNLFIAIVDESIGKALFQAKAVFKSYMLDEVKFSWLCRCFNYPRGRDD